MMNVLTIDAASPVPAVCVVSGGRLVEEPLPGDARASEALLPAIGRALAAAGLDLADCARIAVCAGPGSFTGLRVALATAWGLGRARGIPVEAVSTLEAMAESAREAGVRRVVAALDALRGELVCEEFALDGDRARSLAPARLLPRGDVRRAFPGAHVVALPAGLVPEASEPSRPGVAGALARAVQRAPGAFSVEAIYSRPSAAEEKRGAP